MRLGEIYGQIVTEDWKKEFEKNGVGVVKPNTSISLIALLYIQHNDFQLHLSFMPTSLFDTLHLNKVVCTTFAPALIELSTDCMQHGH